MANKERESFLFRLVILASVAFLVTVLGVVASALSPAQSPILLWLNRHAIGLLALEVSSILVAGFLAMMFDRRQPSRESTVQLPPENQVE